MVNIPLRFKRVAAAFDEVARVRLCESSGSEHSSAAESVTDLSDLVNSFLEGDIREQKQDDEVVVDQENDKDEVESDNNGTDSFEMIKDCLKCLFLGFEDDDAKRNIHAEVQKGLLEVGKGWTSPDFKRRLMAWLRAKGFDAGICKSRWEKTGHCTAGNYDYIDVNIAGTRYIVEVFLAGEFSIARPTSNYTSLLEVFPPIFIGREEEMKKMIRLMASAIRKSMKHMEIYVPPWRRVAYMQAKWLGAHKRTMNEIPVRNASISNSDVMRKRWIGFDPERDNFYRCREDFSRYKGGVGVGNLAAALNCD